MYKLSWLSATETYELNQTRDRGKLGIDPGSPEWFTWLEQVSSFAFSGKNGHYTARKEARQRGDRYWYAYLATGEHLAKKYLGKTGDLSLARMEQIADMLSVAQAVRVQPQKEKLFQSAQSGFQTPPHVFQAAAPDGEVETAKPPLFVQRRSPLHPLLATKLHVPHPRQHLVLRPHLISRLAQGMERTLTLVSAPAGFGKTTLLAQWLAVSGMPAAWLSLEAEDNDPARFISYLIAALQTLDVQIGTTALAMLRTAQPPSPETVLATLISDLISRDTEDITLVLDDYHMITAESIQRGMTFLLEHLPPQLHLVLATRADPPLPLARMRAQGQLTEVRTADLRFGAAEASAFLQEVMQLDLQAADINTLERRTEGWIAGLQFAALSLQGRADVAEFLTAFRGTHRYVLDYLSEEVLARQSTVVQQFLLHTCLLERLSGALCDAVTEQEGSQAMLEDLERANLFLVPLDDERSWYRYHHLFAEALRSLLQQSQPSLLPALHRRASLWYQQHGMVIEAVHHALAASDIEHVADLIEQHGYPFALHGQLHTVLAWLKRLPDTLILTRPQLCILHAVVLLLSNQVEASIARLNDAERCLRDTAPTEATRTMLGHVAVTRGYVGLYFGDVEQHIECSRQAYDLLPQTEPDWMGVRLGMASAYIVSGEVTSAVEEQVADVVALTRTSADFAAFLGSVGLLGRLQVRQGRLRAAAATYERAMQVIPGWEGLQTVINSANCYFSMGDLLREWNELDAAEQYLAQGMDLSRGTLTVYAITVTLGYMSLARLQQARGNFQEALATLHTFEELAQQRHFIPRLVAQGAAVQAQVEIAYGNLAGAVRWADASDLSATDDDLPYPREGEYLALARVRIAQSRSDSATPDLQDVLHLLDRLLQDAEAKARMGSALEILVLQALAMEAQGNRTSALSTLERALILAEPEGYIRLFVDEGEPMRALLRLAHTRSRVPGYVATLLNAFGEQHISELPSTSARTSPLAEPLTEREREVLHLLLAGASNREIARRLIVSVNTVKRHVYNLSGKLGVQSRAQATARARSLNLL
jgi:LuxR family maltose regulon positive regulatory protein